MPQKHCQKCLFATFGDEKTAICYYYIMYARIDRRPIPPPESSLFEREELPEGKKRPKARLVSFFGDENEEKEKENIGQDSNNQKLNIAMGKASLLARIIQKIEEEEAAAAAEKGE